MAWGLRGALADSEAEEKDEVREGEEAEGDPEIEEEMGVEGVAVLRCVDGQIPEAVGWRDGLQGLHGLIVEGCSPPALDGGAGATACAMAIGVARGWLGWLGKAAATCTSGSGDEEMKEWTGQQGFRRQQGFRL